MKKSFVSPLFAWTDAVLKGGHMMLDSMHAAAKRSGSARVAVIPTADAPSRRAAAAKPNARRKAKRRSKAKRG